MIWSRTLNCPREMPVVRLAIGPKAASIWWVNGKRVIGIYSDRQTVIDDGVFGDKAAFKLPSIPGSFESLTGIVTPWKMLISFGLTPFNRSLLLAHVA